MNLAIRVRNGGLLPALSDHPSLASALNTIKEKLHVKGPLPGCHSTRLQLAHNICLFSHLTLSVKQDEPLSQYSDVIQVILLQLGLKKLKIPSLNCVC